MTSTPRTRAREQTMRDIVRIGREHLVATGPTALSLRAVARDLGVVSSAVYRYVRNRDELLTLLVVDAYDELGDAVDAAVDGAAEPLAQFRQLGRAVREWALREPARYALLYGTPVPGYEAPGEQTTAPGTRVIVALTTILERAHSTGAGGSTPIAAPADSGSARAGALAADFARIRDEFGLTLTDDALARGVLTWAALFGAVSFEVFDQYGSDTFTDPGALFERHLAHLAQMAGL
ncbi:TetR/AcrR family transcriptional regulator [Tomitella fengzijianii]|uniref:TetR/AcrR family transcriptional regulator n=1 Tax=Tomitella fengzijianii TaxID=2597660 RepID=A0A516X236_9ACTN|nr:TetR-like C-terminal domain-containing protein [Tomitella fengzijianii]QDQ97139.1 TetR/AcrR family transcriptional regulator [Tomitella fengzijianii]